MLPFVHISRLAVFFVFAANRVLGFYVIKLIGRSDRQKTGRHYPLITHRDLAELLRDLAGRLRQIVEFEFMALTLHDNASNTMRLVVQDSLHPDPPPLGSTFPVEESAPGWVWKNQQPLVIPNAAEETRWPGFIEQMPR